MGYDKKPASHDAGKIDDRLNKIYETLDQIFVKGFVDNF